jgi:hypothetical protein
VSFLDRVVEPDKSGKTKGPSILSVAVYDTFGFIGGMHPCSMEAFLNWMKYRVYD